MGDIKGMYDGDPGAEQDALARLQGEMPTLDEDSLTHYLVALETMALNGGDRIEAEFYASTSLALMNAAIASGLSTDEIDNALTRSCEAIYGEAGMPTPGITPSPAAIYQNTIRNRVIRPILRAVQSKGLSGEEAVRYVQGLQGKALNSGLKILVGSAEEGLVEARLPYGAVIQGLEFELAARLLIAK